jgi:hypothetical protein
VTIRYEEYADALGQRRRAEIIILNWNRRREAIDAEEITTLEAEVAPFMALIDAFEALPLSEREEARAQCEARASRRDELKRAFLAQCEREEAERRAVTKAQNALSAERRATRSRRPQELPKLRPRPRPAETVRIVERVDVHFPAPVVEAPERADDTPAWLCDEIDRMSRHVEDLAPWELRQTRSRRYEGLERHRKTGLLW